MKFCTEWFQKAIGVSNANHSVIPRILSWSWRGKQKITCTCTNKRYVTLFCLYKWHNTFIRTAWFHTQNAYNGSQNHLPSPQVGSQNHQPSPQDASPSSSCSTSYLNNHTQVISNIGNRCHYSLWRSLFNTVSKLQHTNQNKALLLSTATFLFRAVSRFLRRKNRMYLASPSLK
jgi:hypothetical protein